MDELAARRIRKAIAKVQLEEAELWTAILDVFLSRGIGDLRGLKAARTRAAFQERAAFWSKKVVTR